MSAKLTIEYPFGSLVRIGVRFTDPNRIDAPIDSATGNTLIDPTTVTVKIKMPDASVLAKVFGVDSEVIRDSDGAYHMDVSCNQAGVWVWGWFGTGAGQAADEMSFKVAATAFP